jgi:hypothetical protein
VSLEDFYQQHLAYSRALSTLTDCNDEKTKILSTPFGGLHVIFVGDFYQLKCVANKVACSRIRSRPT